MIRLAALIATLLFMSDAMAAVPPTGSSVVEPALQQCILAATTQNSDSEASPLITDCISVGSNACQNESNGSSNAKIISCDGQELAFWDALMSFEFGSLQKSLNRDALASLKAAQKLWAPWRQARCDFVRKSGKDTAQIGVDVSYCLMETTALRAIDLMVAL
jgi:uncharacterized protein YecT (DUF1311 family)